jgi:hypothetical protein
MALDHLRIFTRKLKTRRSFSRRMVENHPGKKQWGSWGRRIGLPPLSGEDVRQGDG